MNHIDLIYMYKPDLALNNQQWLICHKTKPNTKEVVIFPDKKVNNTNKLDFWQSTEGFHKFGFLICLRYFSKYSLFCIHVNTGFKNRNHLKKCWLVGCVLWCINHCGLFNDKFCAYI